MDFLTVLKYLISAAETAALIGALVFSAKGLKERKKKDDRKSLLTQGAFYLTVFLVLKMIRLMCFGS